MISELTAPEPVKPPSSSMTEAAAGRISGLHARYIPFVPTPKEPTDDCPGHRCQLCFKEDTRIVTHYDGGVPVKEPVTYFHLKAFGRTWEEAVAYWKASKATEARS